MTNVCFIDPVSLILYCCSFNHINIQPCFAHYLNLRDKDQYTLTCAHTSAHTCTIPKDLCVAGGAVSFNDGEDSPGEASLSSILSGVLADSAHQHDTDVGQRRGNVAYSSHSGEQKKVQWHVAFGSIIVWLHSRNSKF